MRRKNGLKIPKTACCVRDRVLNAAESLIRRLGACSLTLDAIAREAGISKGGLLFHFPSKQALIHAAVTQLIARCETAQLEAIKKDCSCHGRFTRAYLDARVAVSNSADISFASLLLAGIDTRQLAPLSDRVTLWERTLENDGIDPAHALIVRLAADGIVLNRLFGLPLPDHELLLKAVSRLRCSTHNDVESHWCRT